MRNKYLIFIYQGPFDGWSLVSYSNATSCVVYDSEGIDNLEDAKKNFECVQNGIGDEPLILVKVICDNKVEQEYK